MGTIDKVWLKAFCANCGSSEVHPVSDKGSMWSGTRGT